MRQRVFSVLTALCLALALQLPALAAEYPDMPGEGEWSYEALTAAVDNGLLRGSDGLLRPGAPLTRAELAAIVTRAFGAAEEAAISFSDVSAGSWYASDVARAAAMGVFQGSDGRMRPDDSLTRQETFVVLARALCLGEGSTAVLAAFSDGGQVSGWAAPAVAAMVSAGYVQGSGGLLAPQADITRAEFAQVMHNIISAYVTEAGTYDSLSGGTVLIRAAGTTLRGVTVDGDLIIGDGVGSGDVTLDGVTVTGRLLVRGGGEASIHIVGGSDVGSLVLSKTASGGVRVRTDGDSRVRTVYVADGSDDVILEGGFTQVTVESDVPVVLREAAVETLTVSAAGASVSLEGAATVAAVSIPASARGAALTVGETAAVTTVTSAAEGVTISGDGKVESVTVSGSNTAVDVAAGEINVEPGTSGTTQDGQDVATGGNTGGSGSTGGNAGTGGVVIPDGWYDYTATVSTAGEFIQALADPYCEAIVVSGGVELEGGSYTISKPVTTGGLDNYLCFLNAQVVNDSTITVLPFEVTDEKTGFSGFMVDADFTVESTAFTNNGTLTVQEGGYADVTASTFTNTGTVNNSGELYLCITGETVNRGTIDNQGYWASWVRRVQDPETEEWTVIYTGPFTNAAGAVIRSSGSMYYSWTNESFTNAGTVVASGEWFQFFCPVTNTGSITIQNGCYSSVESASKDMASDGKDHIAGLTNSGTITVTDGATLDLNGSDVESQSVNTGTITAAGAGMGIVGGAVLDNRGTLSISGQGGRLSVGADYTYNDEVGQEVHVSTPGSLVNSGAVTVADSAWVDVQVEGSVLTNEAAGAITVESARLAASLGGSIQNNGTITVAGDSSVDIGTDGGASFTGNAVESQSGAGEAAA